MAITQVPPSPQGAPLAEGQSEDGLMQTPHACDVPLPASSAPRQVASVQVPPSHGCPISDVGQATGSQKPHGCSATAPSSGFSLLQVDSMHMPTQAGRPGTAEPPGPQDLPNSEAGHCCADPVAAKSSVASAATTGTTLFMAAI